MLLFYLSSIKPPDHMIMIIYGRGLLQNLILYWSRDPCNLPRWVQDLQFSVGTRQSFQNLDSYNGGTLQNVRNCLLDSSKLNCYKNPCWGARVCVCVWGGGGGDLRVYKIYYFKDFFHHAHEIVIKIYIHVHQIFSSYHFALLCNF